MGGLILEIGDMSWAGSSQGCAAYYFISSWMLGLSNYLVVCLVCLLLVKRAPGVLARLHVSLIKKNIQAYLTWIQRPLLFMQGLALHSPVFTNETT